MYGVPLVADRLVGYSKVDPEVSRDLFIRHALVEGDWRTHHRFFAANRALLQDVEALEQRARRRDLLVDDQVLFDFYDARIPGVVVSGRHFDGWWKKVRHEQPELLTFTPDLLVRDEAEAVSDEDYPTVWRLPDAELPVTYQFEPGTAADGVTVHVPLPVLGRLRPEPFEWQIPGLRHELVTQLIRSLPKAVRRSLIPAPDRAADVLRHVTPSDGALLEVLSDTLERLTGTHVDLEDWAPEAVPPHLRATFRVEDPGGRVLGESKDLRELQQRLRPKLREVIAKAPDSIEREGLRQWDFGPLPSTHRTVADGHLVEGFPALVDTGDGVALRVFTLQDEAAAAHVGGVRRLLRLAVPSPVPFVLSRLTNAQKLVLSRARHASATELVEDCTDAAVDLLVGRHGGAATVRTPRTLRRGAGRRPRRPGRADARRGAARGARARGDLRRRVAAQGDDVAAAPAVADGPARSPRPPGATALRDRGRSRAAARPAAVRAGHGGAARPATRRPGPRPNGDGPGRDGAGRARRRPGPRADGPLGEPGAA